MLQSLVETAMLAAVSGLAFTLATLLRLDSYLGYFLPMPVIVAAMRSGPAAGRKTMTATCFLLLCKPRLKFACGNSMHRMTQTASLYWMPNGVIFSSFCVLVNTHRQALPRNTMGSCLHLHNC